MMSWTLTEEKIGAYYFIDWYHMVWSHFMGNVLKATLCFYLGVSPKCIHIGCMGGKYPINWHLVGLGEYPPFGKNSPLGKGMQNMLLENISYNFYKQYQNILPFQILFQSDLKFHFHFLKSKLFKPLSFSNFPTFLYLFF